MKKKPQPRQKHIPERTCVLCRTRRAKRDLVRIVHLTEGGVVVDETGKRKGRGAYLCRQQACWTLALKRGALNQALRTNLSAEEITELQRYAATLPETLEAERTERAGFENSVKED